MIALKIAAKVKAFYLGKLLFFDITYPATIRQCQINPDMFIYFNGFAFKFANVEHVSYNRQDPNQRIHINRPAAYFLMSQNRIIYTRWFMADKFTIKIGHFVICLPLENIS